MRGGGRLRRARRGGACILYTLLQRYHCGEKRWGVNERQVLPDTTFLFVMESEALLTVAALRVQSVTNWVQHVQLSVPFQRGPPMEAQLTEGTTLPKALFEYRISCQGPFVRAVLPVG